VNERDHHEDEEHEALKNLQDADMLPEEEAGDVPEDENPEHG